MGMSRKEGVTEVLWGKEKRSLAGDRWFKGGGRETNAKRGGSNEG